MAYYGRCCADGHAGSAVYAKQAVVLLELFRKRHYPGMTFSRKLVYPEMGYV